MKFGVLIFMIFSSLCVSQTEMIIWDSSEKLEWSDFQGVPPKEKGLRLAVSSVKIVVKRGSYYDDDIPNYTVNSYFDKKESWSVTTSEKSLLHERLHFDITEVYSRKIRCKLQKLTEDEEKDVNVYKEAYRKLLKEHGEVQDRYDNEVYFNEVKQQEWIDNIHKELEELKEYEYVPDE